MYGLYFPSNLENFQPLLLKIVLSCPVFWDYSCIYFMVISGEGNGNPLQYSCLENLMDRGAWWAAVHGVTKSWTRLKDFPFTFHFPALEKEMATHSSILAWRIPGKAEPGGLLSMGSHKGGHDWSDLAAAAAWRLELTHSSLMSCLFFKLFFLCFL